MSGVARTFKHGVHPGDFKELTRDQPVERVPLPPTLTVPLSQHLGAASVPLVSAGDYVRRGELIAKAGGYVSSTLHAPCTGTVKSVGPSHHASGKLVDAIVIERDHASAQTLNVERPPDWRTQSREEIIQQIAAGGFVGLGGAAFPTHVKLTPPEGKTAEFFIVNAAECEPYLNSDYRILLEQTDAIIEGIQIILRALGAKKAFVGTEDNKSDAAELLRQRLPPELPVEVVVFETKYPQGAEKMLIDAVLHREVPSGRLPIDLHVVVNNVGTVAGIGSMYLTGQPLIERVVTVTGPGIRQPRNLMVPVGTPLQHVIDHCGGISPDTRQILFGGPMMGQAQRFLDVPVMKGTSGILCLTDGEVVERTEYACIKCLRCVDACPVYLNPSRLGALAKARLYEEMVDHHVMDCMECASCSFVCPSNIPLVQRFRVAKGLLKEQAAREKAAGGRA